MNEHITGEDKNGNSSREPGRAIVLATNIAESGITIPDVGVVIDYGMEKFPKFDPRTSTVSTANVSGSGRRQGLSCSSGMTEQSVMCVQEETLWLVMQKRALSCGRRNTMAPQIFLMLGYALQSTHYSQLSTTGFQTQTYLQCIHRTTDLLLVQSGIPCKNVPTP